MGLIQEACVMDGDQVRPAKGFSLGQFLCRQRFFISLLRGSLAHISATKVYISDVWYLFAVMVFFWRQ
jgi:hypothetical protein